MSAEVGRVLEVKGKEQSYSFVERPAAVIIVPVTSDGKIVTARQYRYPIDEWCVEIPAGGTHDTGAESLRQVARDELRQQVGGMAETLTHVGRFYTSPSLTTEKCHMFLTDNVTLTRRAEREPTEEIRTEPKPAREVMEEVRSGKIKNAPCALAVLLGEPLLRERGYLD